MYSIKYQIIITRNMNFNYQKMGKNPKFVGECMAGRFVRVQMRVEEQKQQSAQEIYVITTSKLYQKDHTTSEVYREEEQIRLLKDHINNEYGGFLIPVFEDSIFEKEEEVKTAILATYFNDLLKHKMIREDKELFIFCFVQESLLNKKSRYERLLSKLINMSREYLNKVLTREDNIDCEQEDTLLDQYRVQINEQEKIYKDFQLHVKAKLQEQLCHKQIISLMSKYTICTKQLYYEQASELLIRCEKISNIFDQVRDAFKRRVILRETIKELKANAIRSKYNSKYESTDKELRDNIKKYGLWTEQLLRDLQCNVVVISSLVREIIMVYYQLMRKSYVQQQ